MSEMEQLRLSNRAAWVGRPDLERRAKKLLEHVDCPWVIVHAASGAPSTEHSMVCGFYFRNAQMLAFDPTCPSLGRINSCKIVQKMARERRHEWMSDFLDMRRRQVALGEHVKKVDYNTGWFEYLPERVRSDER